MLSKYQIQRIKKLLNDGVSQEEIKNRVGTTRHQVRKIHEQIKNENVEETLSNGSSLEVHRELIVHCLEVKGMSAYLIHKHLQNKKIKCSLSTVQRYVRSLKKGEVYVPVITAPGEEAQVDYGYFGEFDKDGKKIKVWVFNMVLSYSRYAWYTIVTEQTVTSFINCHRQAFEFFGGVPASIKIDNLGAGVIEADFFEPYFQEKYLDFLAYYKTTAVTARICRGQDKGKVEAGVKYVKANFLKNLKHSDFYKLASDLKKWIKYDCNIRIHGTTRNVPNDEFIKNEKSKLTLLPAEPYTIIEKEQRKVDQYGHIYFQYCYYSVPHHYAGETVIVHSNGTMITVFKGAKELASHVISKKKGIFVTLDSHKPYHKQLKTDQYYYEEVEKIGISAVKVLEFMRGEKPFHWKNMIKGVITLSKLYSAWIVNKACEKAIECGDHSYRYVKHVCEKKLYEDEKKETAFPMNVGGYYHDLSIYDQLATQ
jgi:transposase